MITKDQKAIADVYAGRLRKAETVVDMDNIFIQVQGYIERVEKREKDFNAREWIGYLMAQIQGE